MKRSQVNNSIDKALDILKQNYISLPMFGYWHIRDWQNNSEDTSLIRQLMLGWDVTDFGSGDFEKTGAVLFTARNGSIYNNTGTPYAEKYIILMDKAQQEIPFHFHIKKTEDIINRGGGTLCIEVFGSLENGGIDKNSPVTLYFDGIKKTIAPGTIVEINRGESITLVPKVYHRFYAKNGYGTLVAGEISSVNDDKKDNIFLEKSERFSSVFEDEQAKYILVNEYEKYFKR